MEKQLFNFVEFDVLDTAVFQFYEITLNQDIEEFVIGDKFNAAIVDYEHATMTLYRGEDKWKYKLTFLVGSKLE